MTEQYIDLIYSPIKHKVLHFKWFLLFVLIGVVAGQSLAGYEIAKYTINSGGSKMTSSSGYELNASIGQIDAVSNLTSPNNYSLKGGFWASNNDLIYKNGFE